jgi:putative flavoprotein involved in K+ transport
VTNAPVVVIGGGQAGLAVSHELTALEVEHVVLERQRIAEAWRGRWDSFCLVTPNWTMSLPGAPYAGGEPEGFVRRDEIVAYMEGYAAGFGAPTQTGVGVDSLKPSPAGGFVLRTTEGELRADMVVVCTGAYQRPHRPAVAGAFPAQVLAIDAEQYRNPDGLPAGRVLVVGSGQTGCQIAEELHESGREVAVACGRAPWAPRRFEGRDVVSWIRETNFFDTPLASLPSPGARLTANVQATGRRGGHDLHYRTLQALGVQLLGRLVAVDGSRAHFADDLAESVAFGDARYGDLKNLLREQLPAKGLAVPDLPDPPPFRAEPPSQLDLRDFGTVIYTCGFRPDYGRWIQFPAFDDIGFPITNDGASTIVPGLFFCGVHFLRTRKSSVLFGVGDDATVVARAVAQRRARRA